MPKLLNEERAKGVMDRLGVDALVACTPHNFQYISGWHADSHLWSGGDFAILPNRDDIPVTLVMAANELGLANVDPDWQPEIRTFGRVLEPTLPPDYQTLPQEDRFIANFNGRVGKHWPDRMRALAEALAALGLTNAHLGFDDVRVATALQENGQFKGKVTDAIWPFRHIRIVKTPREIEIMRRANDINLAGIQDVIDALKEGNLLISGNWPPSKPGLTPPPDRDF